MTTEKQIAANRKNAKKGGVKTVNGKNAVKTNALKHGILTKDIILDKGGLKESLSDFEALKKALYDDLQPSGSLEDLLFEKVLLTYWRWRRIIRSEKALIETELLTADQNFSRHDMFEKFFGAKTDKHNQDGFQPDSYPAEDKLDAHRGTRLMLNEKELNKLQRYEAHLHRCFMQSLHELQRVQAAKKGQTTSMVAALDVNINSENGFVS